jgi:hypothetical protein
MSQVINNTVHVPQSTVQIQTQQQQKTQVNQPGLPSPAEVLDRALHRFPTASQNILKGQATPLHRPATVFDQAQQQIGNNLRDTAPIMVGQGENSRVALMPTKGVHGPDKAATIQGYVNKGKDIYDKVMNNTYPHAQPSKQDVAKLMWYLQALSSGKASESSGDGQHPVLYKEGAMFVEDPDHRLESFLTRANSYARSSSHMKDYQAMGNDYRAHGVDLRNVDTPNKRGTVMFARLPDGDGPVGGPKGTGDRRMLFIKMEPHGCRGLTARGSGTPREPGTAGSSWKGFKRFFLNAKDLFMHGTGFVQSVGQRTGILKVDGQNNRERIPSEIKNSYQGIIDQAGTLGLQATKTALNARRPLSDAGGIKQMLPNLEEALRNVPDTEANRDFRAQINALKTQLSSRDHPELRIGNEIILTRDEMNIGSARA